MYAGVVYEQGGAVAICASIGCTQSFTSEKSIFGFFCLFCLFAIINQLTAIDSNLHTHGGIWHARILAIAFDFEWT